MSELHQLHASRVHSKDLNRGNRLGDFLQLLLGRESGIDPNGFNWYVENLDKRCITYPIIVGPKYALRDKQGRFLLKEYTVREYFCALEVDHLFDATSEHCIYQMQCAAINPLGFVGYQFGEAILDELGYYELRQIDLYNSSERVQSRDILPSAAETSLTREWLGDAMFSAPLNTWRGKFTGKHGVSSLADLRTPLAQELIIREALRSYLRQLRKFIPLIKSEPPAASLVIRTSICDKLPPLHVDCTTSGLLAAAHLCGVPAVAEFLASGIIARDEFGTSLLDYVQEFAGYDIEIEL